VRGLPTGDALIDGEAAVLREDGKSHFLALLTKRGGSEASLVAYDFLRLEGDGLRFGRAWRRSRSRWASGNIVLARPRAAARASTITVLIRASG
jgi:hypothetical protein